MAGSYGYTPTAGWCLTFMVLFALSALVHSVQAARSKYWIIYPTLVVGALLELLGWAGRYWSSQDIEALTPFLMQICSLIIAPVFFSAYCYAVLGSAIHKLGAQYSALPAKWYFIVFILADVVSLVLQAIGGGQAAESAATSAPTDSATNTMVAGIIFQLITMGIFIVLGIDFCIRANAGRAYAFRINQIKKQQQKLQEKNGQGDVALGGMGAYAEMSGGQNSQADLVHPMKSSSYGTVADRREMRRWWIMACGVGIASLFIFIRGIYRSVELVQGWSGYLITHEIYQNVLDGIPMVIAVAIFNVINPLFVLPKKERWGSYY